MAKWCNGAVPVGVEVAQQTQSLCQLYFPVLTL